MVFARYYLIICSTGKEVDLAKMRRWSLRIIWLATPLYLALSIVPGILINRSHGWPEIPLKKLDRSVTILNVVISTALSNVPDLVSLAVYARMLRALRSQVHPVTAEEEDPYGGIWVGEEESSPGVQPGGGDEIGLQVIGGGSDRNPPQHHHQKQTPPEPQANNKEATDKIKSVMRVLRTHSAVSLLDVSMVLSSLFFCSRYGVVLAYGMQFLFGFWVPLLVISRNFKQFDSLWSYVSREMCRP